MMLVSINVKCGTSLRFQGDKSWINEIDPYGWFQWYFSGKVEDQKMTKDKLIDEKELKVDLEVNQSR